VGRPNDLAREKLKRPIPAPIVISAREAFSKTDVEVDAFQVQTEFDSIQ
jgi:hypothetical protein